MYPQLGIGEWKEESMLNIVADSILAGRFPIIISNNPWIMGVGVVVMLGVLIYRVMDE